MGGRRPYILAWAATLAAGGLAIWPKADALLHGGTARYSPEVALTCLTAIVVVWYTYFTQQTLAHARDTSEAEANRQRSERDERRDAVDAQISAIAYALRRELQAMLDQPSRKGGSAHDWATAASQGFLVTERRILKLMSLAPEASATTAATLREAYVAYYAGTQALNLIRGEPVTFDLTRMAERSHQRVQRFLGAEADLEDCVAAVERTIAPDLMRAAREREARKVDGLAPQPG